MLYLTAPHILFFYRFRLYPAGTNVSDARKALICNGFRASDMLRGSAAIIVSGGKKLR